MYLNNINRFFIKQILFFIFTLSLYGEETALEKLKVQLQWKHQFEFAGFYAAQEKGFYKEVGLDVEFLEFHNGSDIVDEVLSSRVEYGTGYSSIIAAYYSGKPIVMLANFFKQSPLVLVTQPEIKTPADLKNKKIMGSSDTIDSITLMDMLGKFDIQSDDYVSVATNFKLESFIDKKVDAMSVFTTNEIFYLDQQGVKYNLFDPASYGVEYYDNNLFTSKQELLTHPDRVKNFTHATIKGWEYALAHQEEIIELIQKKYNTQHKSYEALNFEAKQIEAVMLPNVHSIGSIDKNRVQMIADSFMQAGFINNDYYKSLNDFIYTNKAYLSLTQEEQKYLHKKEKITLCVDPNWMPLEGFIDGKYSGLSSDFIAEISKSIDVPFDVLQTKSWRESLAYAKEKKCDILPLIAETPQRKEFLDFTQSYVELPIAIVTKKETRSILDVHMLDNVNIAVVNDYAYLDILKTRYKNINVIHVNSVDEGLEKVLSGEVFGFIDTSVVVEYYSKEEGFENLKFNIQLDEKLKFSMGVRNDDRILWSIINKSLQNIDEKREFEILKKWLYIQYEKVFDYTMLWKIGFFFLLAIVFILYKQVRLIRHNLSLQRNIEENIEEFRKKDKVIYHQNKLISMGEMMENIAHQWRQPLSQINSSILVLDALLEERGKKDTEVEKKLLEIESLTVHMSKTINDFREYYSPNKVREKFILQHCISQAQEIVSTTFTRSNIELDFQSKEEYFYYGYENELKQVILVILNNARDAFSLADIKNPKVTFTLFADESYFTLKICDNANGIDDSIIERIFEPYFTTKHKSQGTGLGLYIAKLIVEDSLEGELNVQSSTTGTCFEIKLKVSHE